MIQLIKSLAKTQTDEAQILIRVLGFLSLPAHPEWLCSLSSKYWRQSSYSMKMVTVLHLLPRSRMHQALSP